SNSSYAGQTIYGQIKSIDGTALTLQIGTQKDGSSDLDLTDETADITLSEDATVTRGGMGGGGNDNGQPPEKPDDSSSSGNSASESSDSGSDSKSGSSSSTGSNGSSNSSSGSSGSDTGNQKPDTETSDDTSSKEKTAGRSNSKGSAPDGESINSSSSSTEAPGGNPPSGQAPGGESINSSSSSDTGAPGGNAPDGQAPGQEDLDISSLAEGDSVAITFDDDGTVTSVEILGGSGAPGGDMGGQSSSSADISYSAVQDITSDTSLSNESVDSTGTDENAILTESGATSTLSNLKITRNSDDSTGGNNSSFYGVGAAVLTTDGTTYLKGSTITTDAEGGAGVFSYGDGTTYVSDTTISTSKGTSGGLHVAGGGKLYAYDDTVTTEGESSAAIRSDRGGGTMVVDGGSYTSNGTGSPAVYSTADITVNNATLTANNSEAVCIEGANTVRLFDCNLTGNMPENDQNDCTWNVILYQSMSGDSEEGNSTFEMNGGSITAKNGGMFYTTNTESTFVLDNVDITYADENDYFLKVTGNSNARGWGSSGSNGADCTFTGISQEMQGDIIWDSISQLDFYMTDGSTLTGAITDDESNAGDGGSGYCNIYIDSSSTWTVTKDSAVTNLYNAGTIKDADGNTVTIKGTDGTVYQQGTGSITITVSSYSTNADLSGASSADSWSTYETAKPSELA
ncbi:MAG: hypothetical protein LIV24_05745, partial [Eubacterium sp.]|nr:hypothetical protein [Eubacterium sp.]